MEGFPAPLFGVIAGFMLVVASSLGYWVALQDAKQSAVENNVAEYYINENHERDFRYLKCN